MGCPGAENYKNLLRQNIIMNCPKTVDLVNIAKTIFGPDIGSLKGKTTRKKPTPVRHDYVEIPPELIDQHKNLVFYMDIYYICGLPILSGIDRSVKGRSSVPLKSKDNEHIYKAIDKVFRKYQQGGFFITNIHCNQQFHSLMDPIANDLNIKMNYTTTNKHVPEAERNNRTIKEKIRAVYHSLPYKAMPPVMLKYLAVVCTNQLNMIPAKGGILDYLSPHVILTGKNIDYNKHCQVPFGAYVQCNNKNNPTNSNAPQTLDAIYLRPTTNLQGGHKVMNLATGQVLTRPQVCEIPVTPVVIKAVEKLAAQ
jgi:hypothetical protein